MDHSCESDVEKIITQKDAVEPDGELFGRLDNKLQLKMIQNKVERLEETSNKVPREKASIASYLSDAAVHNGEMPIKYDDEKNNSGIAKRLMLDATSGQRTLASVDSHANEKWPIHGNLSTKETTSESKMQEPIENDVRKLDGNLNRADGFNESEHSSKCEDNDDIPMEKIGQSTDWDEHKQAWAEFLERNGIPHRAYAMLLGQVHDLHALVARLKAIPNVRHLAKPLIDDQRRRVLLKLMTTVPGVEIRRRLFLEQLICLGHHPEFAEERVQNAVLELESEPGCNSDILQMMENAAIASLPRGKLRWLQVLLQYQFSKADAVMLIQDAEDVKALLSNLAKQFPSFRRHLSALQREIGEMNRETKVDGKPIGNDLRKQDGNGHAVESNESDYNNKCKDKEDIAMEKKDQPTNWHEHKRAWAQLLERNGIPRRAYAMLLEQVHDLNALVARLKAIPNVKHLAKPLIDDQRRRVLSKLMTTVPGAENRRRLFLEQLVCLGHPPEVAERRVQNAVFQLKSEPGCNSEILQMMENAAIASLPRGKLRWLKVLLKFQVSKADAVMLMHDVEDVNALLSKLAKELPSLPSDQVVTAIAIPDLPRGKWPWFVRLVKRNIMPKPEALLLLHGANDANAIVNKLRARFPLLDVGAIAAEIVIAEFPQRKQPWLKVLLEHKVMPRSDAMLFLHGAECAGAVVDKLKERFPWLEIGGIEEEIRGAIGSVTFSVQRKADAARSSSTAGEDTLLSLPVPTIRLTGVVEGHISYHKLRNLGVGGFGEVFKGEQMSGKLFAFKRSLPKAKATSDIDYWINEQLHAVKSLAHEAEVYFDPNFNSGNCRHLTLLYDIVEIFNSDGDREPLLVMQFADGPCSTLREWLLQHDKERIDVTIKDRLSFAVQMCAGLRELHYGAAPAPSGGSTATCALFVHQDLKPDNILLFGSGASNDSGHVRLALTDFGLTTQYNVSAQRSYRGCCGTPSYMAPEQWLGEPVQTPSRDMWAAGLVLSQLFGGIRTRRAFSNYRHFCRRTDVKTTTGALLQLQTMAVKIGEALQQDSESSEASKFGTARDTANHSERTTAVRLVQLQVSCLLRRCFVVEKSANAVRPTATECESLLIQLWNALHTSQRWQAYYAGLCAPLESQFAKAFTNAERRGTYFRSVMGGLLRLMLRRCAAIRKSARMLSTNVGSRWLEDRLLLHEHTLRKHWSNSLQRAIQCYRSAEREVKTPACAHCGQQCHDLSKEEGNFTSRRRCPKCKILWYCSAKCQKAFCASSTGRAHYNSGECESWQQLAWLGVGHGVVQLTELVLLQGEMWEISRNTMGSNERNASVVLAQFLKVQRVWERVYITETRLSRNKKIKRAIALGVTRDTGSTGDANSPMAEACSRGLSVLVRTVLEARTSSQYILGVTESELWLWVNEGNIISGMTPLYCACTNGHAGVVSVLLDHAQDTIDVNQARTDDGCTPLFFACQNGHTQVVSVLLDKARDTIDVNQARTDDGATPLYLACKNGHTEVVSVLLDKARDTIDVNQATTDNGSTPLFIACQNGHAKVASVLLDKAWDTIDVNQVRVDNGCTPLFQACQNGHADVVSMLLDKACDTIDANQARKDNGYTPLFIACGNGHTEVVSVLLDKARDTIDVNQATTDNGSTPLFQACREGHAEVVSVLLREAVDTIDVNQATTTSGCTPLFFACQNGHAQVVSVLLDKARDTIDVNQATMTSGRTPLFQACQNGHKEVVSVLLDKARDTIDVNQPQVTTGCTPLFQACNKGHVEVVTMLLEKAWDTIEVNLASAKNGLTPLFQACQNGFANVVSVLLEKAQDTIDVNQAHANGCTPLFQACQNGHAEVVSTLLDIAQDTIDVNKATKSGCTPLFQGCKQGHADVVALLLDKARDTIDVNQARTDNGRTPLCVACRNGHADVVSVLLTQALGTIDVNRATTSQGCTPLFQACDRGHAAVVSVLLTKARDTIDVNKTTPTTGCTPLFKACNNGHAEVVSVLLSQAWDTIDVNKATKDDGATPLFAACDNGHAKVVSVLLDNAENVIDVNQPTKSGCTPLLQGCYNGHADVVSVLLDKAWDTIDVNQPRRDNGRTPLLVACRRGHAKVVSVLLTKAQDMIFVNRATTSGRTPLFFACHNGHAEVVSLLLDKARDSIDINQAQVTTGFTPLFQACNYGHTEVVSVLLDKAQDTIDVNVALKVSGCTPLFQACNEGYVEVMSLLLEKARGKIDVNKARTDNGCTPLFQACRNGDVDAVSLLLTKARDTIDVNKARTDNGRTPLFQACRNGHVEVVSLLLDNATDTIDVNLATTTSGRTPLFIACGNGHANVVSVLLQKTQDTIDVNQPRDNGSTPLFQACNNGHLEVVSLLLDIARDTIDVNQQTMTTGRTPLFQACQHGHADIVSLLLREAHGTIDVNRATASGYTPLFVACQSGHSDVVGVLLREARGTIDVNTVTPNSGYTALYVACQLGHARVVSELLEEARDTIDVNKATATDGSTPLFIAYQEGHSDVVAVMMEKAKDKIDFSRAESMVSSLAHLPEHAGLDTQSMGKNSKCVIS